MTYCEHTHTLYANQAFPTASGRAEDGHLCCGDHECDMQIRFRDQLVEVSDLVGQVDIAIMLGVGPTAVGNWRTRFKAFPEPLVTVNKNTALFSREAIMNWARRNGRA